MNYIQDVIIVGGGPSGLVLAINLLKNGVTAIVIDKRSGCSSESKAITINAATLKLYHNLGIVDRFLDAGFKVRDIFVHWNEKKLMHIDYQYLNSPYKYFLSLPQPDSEKILLQYYLELGGKIQFATELLSINPANLQKVDVTLSKDGKGYNMQTKYLIGCDGAKSTVRNILGAEFIGKDYGIFFELIDVDLDWNGDKLATHYFVTEDSFIIIIPMTGNKHRIVIKNNINNFENIHIQKSIQDYEGIINACCNPYLHIKEIIWRSFSKFYNRLIDNYQFGDRIFFAGDACHLFSPIGGLGMNTGVQDAFNLSWRLSMVLTKKCNSNILEEYNKERRHIGEKLVKSTDKSTELITRININYDDLIAWLPTMRNRENIRQNFPLNFSGLAHNYLFEYKQMYHAPYAVGINSATGKDISTYDMIDGQHFNVLLFTSTQIDESFKQFIIKLSNRKVIIWQVAESLNFNLSQALLIEDCYTQFKSAFNINNVAKLVVIRPDGYIGLTGSMQNQSLLASYLQYYCPYN